MHELPYLISILDTEIRVSSTTLGQDAGTQGQSSLGTPEDNFIQSSTVYQWLLSKMSQSSQLNLRLSEPMLKIGTTIFDELFNRTRRPYYISSDMVEKDAEINFELDWNPIDLARTLGIELKSPLQDILDKTLCLTGSLSEAQIATVREYIHQTWPETAGCILGLLEMLLSCPEGEKCFCKSFL